MQATFAKERLGVRTHSVRTIVTAMASDGKRVIVWLRNDLRLHDNYSLHKAAELVKAGTASEVSFKPSLNAANLSAMVCPLLYGAKPPAMQL